MKTGGAVEPLLVVAAITVMQLKPLVHNNLPNVFKVCIVRSYAIYATTTYGHEPLSVLWTGESMGACNDAGNNLMVSILMNWSYLNPLTAGFLLPAL